MILITHCIKYLSIFATFVVYLLHVNVAKSYELWIKYPWMELFIHAKPYGGLAN